MSDYTGTDNLEMMEEAINYNSYLLSLILTRAKKDETIIDFGSGVGTFARELAKGGYNVHCIEQDNRQTAGIIASGLPVTRSLDDIDGRAVDYLYSLNVLEHIEDDTAILRQIYDKLRPGGKLLIYVPAFQILFSSMDRKVGHYRRYTKDDLIKKLHVAKFDVEDARYVDSIGFFATLYFRFAGNKSGSLNRRALIFYDRFIFPLSRLCDFFCACFFGKNLVIFAKKVKTISLERNLHGLDIPLHVSVHRIRCDIATRD